MKDLKEFLTSHIMGVMSKNEGKNVILKNGSTYTCIGESRRVRYAVGRGKEGRFIFIRSLYDYLKGKKIQAYCVVEDDSINLLSDDIKTLNYTKMPTEKDYDQYVEDEKKSREKKLNEDDVEKWTKLLNDRINDGELITGYTLKDSTCGRYKEVVLDVVDNESKFNLYVGAENEEHLKMILDLVTPLITEKTEDKEDNTNDGINDSEIFYIKTTKGYEEVEGVRIDNKYGLELFCHEIALGNFRLSHIPTGIAINDTITCHKDELLNKIDDLVARNGLDRLKKVFNNAIIKHGYVPNYRLNDGKNDSKTDMDKDKDVLNDVKKQLCKKYDIQKIGLSVCKNPCEDSFRLYVSEMIGKTVKEISIKYESGQSNNIYFTYDDKEYIVLKSIDEVVRLIVKEFNLSPVCTNDGKKDISTLMGSLMSKLESSGELRCFMDSDTLTGIIQQCAESKTYIKYSKNDDCFYIDRDDKTVDLNLIQLIRNKLKHYGIDFEVIKLNGVKHFKIDLNEGNLSVL